jgi:hypothetical protein
VGAATVVSTSADCAAGSSWVVPLLPAQLVAISAAAAAAAKVRLVGDLIAETVARCRPLVSSPTSDAVATTTMLLR